MNGKPGQNAEQRTESWEEDQKSMAHRSQGNRVSQKGVINSVKCCQEIMQRKTESVSW